LEPIEQVVLLRSSQRRMNPNKTLAGSVAHSALAVSLRGVDLPHFVVVNAVDGTEPGIYRWPDLSTPRRAGNFRRELHRVAVDQGLPRDAAFVAIGAADVSALDDREYREAQLAAGLVEGRLHLAAYALGASASGMTFLDSEMPGFLREPLGGLLLTCVGVPEYQSKAGGLPGAPQEITPVTPRLDDEET
jgi:hypothetical protein